MLPKDPLHRYSFGEVVVFRAGSVYIDVIDIFRLQAAHGNRFRHGKECAGSFGR